MKKSLFRFFSIVLACVILMMCFSVPAFAIDYNSAKFNRFKALLASAIQAINIGLSATQASFNDLTNYIADPMNIVYTYSEQASDQYWDQQTIHLYEDYVIIDDVPYTDIWLSHDIAEKMRVDAFDFKTAYSIASNTNGTFANGLGFMDGMPIFRINNLPTTQTIRVPVGTSVFGDVTFQYTQNENDIWILRATKQGFTTSISSLSSSSVAPNCRARFSGYTSGTNYLYASFNNATERSTLWNGYSNGQAFDFDYVAEEIPANETLPQDTGLMLRVPSSYLDEWIEENPDETNVDWDIDIDSPDVMAKLEDLFDLIVPIIPIIEADFSEQHVTPVPPASETIANTDYSVLEQTLQEIRNDIQSIPSAIQQIISNIANKLDNIIQSLGNLGDTILQEIQEGPIDIARKAIDAIKSIFLPILISLKNAIGIWHYVVEWFNAISMPFAWFRGVMASSNPSLLIPIYACIAGIIVISVYRRFGR